VWAQPGTDLVFAWSYRENQKVDHRWERDPYDDQHSSHFRKAEYTVTEAVTPTIVGPGGTIRSLAGVDTEVDPIYWNGGVLWVRDHQGSVFGLGPESTTAAGRGSFTQVGMPIPFVADLYAGRIVDLSTGHTIDVGREAIAATVTMDGRVMRLTRFGAEYGALVVSQVVIDWSGPTPVRLPNVVFKTAPLPASSSPGAPSVREAMTVLPDGRRVAEVVTTSSGSTLYVHDLATHAIVASITVPPSKSQTNAHGSAVLYAIGGDKLAFVAQTEYVEGTGRRCYRGVTVAVAAGVANPIPGGACISAFSGRHGAYWLETNKGTAYVDNRGKVLQLGTNLVDPLVLGPSTIAYTIAGQGGGLDVESFDLATATRTTLGHHADLRDKLLNVLPGRLIFTDGMRIVTETGTGPPTTIELPPVGN
jgi:hypothetical protein